MSIYLEKEYVSRIRPKLPGFTQKSEFLWNFRCPVCGDSKKNKFKMRGYIYRRKNDLFFTCHNCNAAWSFPKLMEYLDRSIYNEYKLDVLRESGKGSKYLEHKAAVKFFQDTKPVFEKKTEIDLPTIESLPDTHLAKTYIRNRRIPQERWSELYYAEDFAAFIKELIPDYSKELQVGEKRLVIPFLDEKNKLLGVQGRDLAGSKVKYISVKLNPENPKVYGLNRLNRDENVLVVEGPFDSMFLPNALATMDSHLEHAVKYVGPDTELTFVYDNQPRNSEIVKTMRKTIEGNHKIVIWPNSMSEKDINDMVLAGYNPSEIAHIIDQNTFQGLRAKLEFDRWRKFN